MSRDIERLETERLILRRPLARDAEAMFLRYASDAEVTRFLSWPRHASVADTIAFLRVSEAAWERDPAGPYLIESAEDGTLLGSTGLQFESPTRAMTGYALARDAWGRGYATEALFAMVELARRLGVRDLFAYCHVDHAASQRVLAKAGFERGEIASAACTFPNLDDPNAATFRFALDLGSAPRDGNGG